MRFLFVLIAIAVFAACLPRVTNPEHTYIAHDKTECRKALSHSCGETLMNCANGYEYYCEKEVVRIK